MVVTKNGKYSPLKVNKKEENHALKFESFIW